MSVERAIDDTRIPWHCSPVFSEQQRLREAALNSIAQFISAYGSDEQYSAIRSWWIDGHRPKAGDILTFLRTATIRGHGDILKYIIDEASEVAQGEIAYLFESAAKNGHLKIVNYFLTDHRDRSLIRFHHALTEASAHAHESIVRELIRYLPDKVLFFDQIISNVASHGWVDILQILLAQRSMSMERSEHPISLAMRERSLSLLLPYKTVVSPVWTLSLKELKAQPERWLARIAERGIPTSIKLIEFPGTIDLDGLMKQFISTLVENLIEKKVFFRSDLGLISSYRQEDIIRLNQLGKFFSYLDSKNNTQLDQLLTGTICHKRFLEFALIAIGDQSDEEKIRQAALLLAKIDPSQALVAKMLIEPSTELKLEFQAVMMASPGDEVNEAQAMLHSYITAAHAIYQGATPAFRIKISQNPVQTLLDVQGEEVSAVGLLRAILVEGDDERLHDQISWIQAFIRSADHALRRKFLKAATGRVTLSPSDRITIKQTLRHDPYFEFHTCLSSIALPQQDLTKEVFIEALKNALDERYNIS